MKHLNWRGSFLARNQYHSSTACSTQSIKRSRTERLDNGCWERESTQGRSMTRRPMLISVRPPAPKSPAAERPFSEDLFTTSKRVLRSATSVLALPLRLPYGFISHVRGGSISMNRDAGLLVRREMLPFWGKAMLDRVRL